MIKFQIKLERNERLAEFIGIMLGDGHLYEKTYRIQISFNGIDEPNYLFYVKNLIKSIFNIDFAIIYSLIFKYRNSNRIG